MAIVYRSDDTSAPSLTREEGSFLTLLQAILVDGYGSKAAAGWSRIYHGANKSVFQNNGSGVYLRVEDAAINSYFGIAKCNLYETAADIDNGTGACPSSSVDTYIQNDKYWFEYYPSNPATSTTPNPWICVADDKTFYISISSTAVDTGPTGTPDFFKSSNFINDVSVMFAGDFESYLNSDGYASVIACYNSQNGAVSPGCTSSDWNLRSTGAYLAFLRGSNRATNGITGAPIPYTTTIPGSLSNNCVSLLPNTIPTYSTEYNSQDRYYPVYLKERIDNTKFAYRGKLRGVYEGFFDNNLNNHSGQVALADGKTLVGFRVDNGKGIWIDTGVW